MAFNRLADSQSKQLAALSVEHGGDTALTVNIGVSDGGAGRGIPGPLRGPESDSAFRLGSSLQTAPPSCPGLCPLPPSSAMPTGRTTPGPSASNSPPRAISQAPEPPYSPDKSLSQVANISPRDRQALWELGAVFPAGP